MSESDNHLVNVPVLANAGAVPSNNTSYRNSVPQSAHVLQSAVPVQSLPPRPEFVIAGANYGLNQTGYTYGGLGSNTMGSYGMNSMGAYGGYSGGYGTGAYNSGYGMGGYSSNYGMPGMGMTNQSPYGYGNAESR